jgi:hypothetical protein
MPRPVHLVINIPLVFFLLLTAACQQGKHEKAPTASPQVKLSTPPPAVDIPILMYHKVDAVAYSKYWVSDRLFDRQISNVEFFGRDGQLTAVASPGDSVVMKVTIRSRGAVLPVQITVKVLSSSDPSITALFSQTLKLDHVNRQAKTYDFNILIPKDIVPGQDYYSISIDDQYAVLEFASSGMKKAFLIKY